MYFFYSKFTVSKENKTYIYVVFRARIYETIARLHRTINNEFYKCFFFVLHSSRDVHIRTLFVGKLYFRESGKLSQSSYITSHMHAENIKNS